MAKKRHGHARLLPLVCLWILRVSNNWTYVQGVYMPGGHISHIKILLDYNVIQVIVMFICFLDYVYEQIK